MRKRIATCTYKSSATPQSKDQSSLDEMCKKAGPFLTPLFPISLAALRFTSLRTSLSTPADGFLIIIAAIIIALIIIAVIIHIIVIIIIIVIVRKYRHHLCNHGSVRR